MRTIYNRPSEPAAPPGTRARGKRAPKLPEPLEHQSQKAFFDRVAMHPKTRHLAIFAIPNGGHRHKAVAAKLKAEGVKSGVPDIFVAEQCGGYPGLFIEMKRLGSGALTDAQRTWHTRLQERGYRVAICYGAEPAWNTLCTYLNFPEWERAESLAAARRGRE